MAQYTHKYPIDEKARAQMAQFQLNECFRGLKEERCHYATVPLLYQYVVAYKESKKIRTALIQQIEQREQGNPKYESIFELYTFIEVNKSEWLVEEMRKHKILSVQDMIAFVKAETKEGVRLPFFVDELKHN